MSIRGRGLRWFHHHGRKVMLKKISISSRLIEMGSNATYVRITPVAETVDEGWCVEWEIKYSRESKVNGRIILETEELRAAFNLPHGPFKYPEQSEWMISQYECEEAVQGGFIRWANCLNIPGPGTGNDGDPNISIEIDEKIQQAIRQITE